MRGSQKKETANEGGVFFPIDEKVPLPELFANFLKFLMVKDRKRYLEFATQLYPDEKANGFYKRNLNSGYGPVEVDVPRTRSSEFRPYILPEHWKRLHPELESLLMCALRSGASRKEIQEMFRSAGIALSEEIVARFEEDSAEYFEWINEGSLPDNALQLLMDAKRVEIKHEGKVMQATIYIAVLVDFEYRKRFCACKITFAKENDQEWLALLTSLVRRGLKKVLIITSDAFPGLMRVTGTVYERALHQLCVTHMFRNLFRNMDKDDAKEFRREFVHQIKPAPNFDAAEPLFESLMRKYESKYPTFIDELRKNAAHYLVFTRFPELVRKHIYTSNLPEGINSAIEKKRKDVAGYFRSEEHFKTNFVVLAKHLHDNEWSKPQINLKAKDYEFRQIFATVYGARP